MVSTLPLIDTTSISKRGHEDLPVCISAHVCRYPSAKLSVGILVFCNSFCTMSLAIPPIVLPFHPFLSIMHGIYYSMKMGNRKYACADPEKCPRPPLRKETTNNARVNKISKYPERLEQDSAPLSLSSDTPGEEKHFSSAILQGRGKKTYLLNLLRHPFLLHDLDHAFKIRP